VTGRFFLNAVYIGDVYVSHEG